MRKALLLILCLTAIAAKAQSDLQKGISWYEQRAEGAQGVTAKREPVEKAIGHLTLAMNEPQSELQAAIHLCRSYIFKGRFVESEPRLRTKALGQAKEIAERMLTKYPNNRELRFEHLAALGLWGESLGIFRAAKEGIATRMREACEAMIRLDPEFMNGVGKRSLAVLNYKVPVIPFIISWPDKKKSLALLAEVMASYPDDLAGNFYYAEALYVNGKKAEAKEYLQRTLSFAPDNSTLLEHRTIHLEAKKLLEQLSAH
jgi:tetratricopeptide (TPR) repeat protein